MRWKKAQFGFKIPTDAWGPHSLCYSSVAAPPRATLLTLAHRSRLQRRQRAVSFSCRTRPPLRVSRRPSSSEGTITTGKHAFIFLLYLIDPSDWERSPPSSFLIRFPWPVFDPLV
jgi:hypothetical protein